MSTLSFHAAADGSLGPNAGKTIEYTMVSSIRDVYAKRTDLTKSALKHSNKPAQTKDQNPNRFSHLLSIMPAGVVVIDQKGLVSLANQQASALLEEPLEGELWRDVIARAFRPQADDGHEVSMKNGKRVKIDISPLTEEKGQLIVITDLSETRQLQSRLSQMQRLSSLGKMVASLAHQVRTPLSSALLYAENIRSVQSAKSTTARFSEKLIMRLKDLESQVNDMLLFAKSGDKQIVKSMSAGDVTKTSTQNVEAQFAQAGVSLEVDNRAKDAALICNMTALSGAISNLLGNALQAITSMHVPSSERPSINCSSIHNKVVRLRVTQIQHEGREHVQFTVSDDGPGIDVAKLAQIFEPFYTTKSQGTGLGLAVVNTVAKSHKGFVSAQNNTNGVGAEFSVCIPVAMTVVHAFSDEGDQSACSNEPNFLNEHTQANKQKAQGVSA